MQADKGPLDVGQITDHFADRWGQLAHQGRDRHDLIPLGQMRLLDQVHDLDRVASRQILLTQPLQVRDRRDRFRRLAVDIEPQFPFPVGRAWARVREIRHAGAGTAVRGSRSWCVIRREPVITPPGPTTTSINSTPSSESTNSRTLFECAMPRDLSTYRPRVRSPFSSMSRTSSQVSMSDETAAWLPSSASPPRVRLVKTAVICFALRKSISRSNIPSDSTELPELTNVVIGSTTTTRG